MSLMISSSDFSLQQDLLIIFSGSFNKSDIFIIGLKLILHSSTVMILLAGIAFSDPVRSL